MRECQVFIIYGFLESGKTQFINFTTSQDYFQMDETTLIVVCEEGMEEYDEKQLALDNTVVEYIEDFSDFTLEKLNELDEKHKPERVLIEYNGMWDCKNIVLPDNWVVRQQITMADAVTFDTYFANMKSLFADMIRNSELLIMNRCHDVEKLKGYKRNIMAINTNIEVVFEDEEGEVELPVSEEDLPYDLNAEIVEIKEDHYGIFYLDLWENTERYVDKTFHFTAMVMKEPGLPKNFFVAGRPAMTCCEDDIVFMGLICKSREAKNLENRDTVDIVTKVVNEYRVDYNGYGPVLYAQNVEKTLPMQDPLVKGF